MVLGIIVYLVAAVIVSLLMYSFTKHCCKHININDWTCKPRPKRNSWKEKYNEYLNTKEWARKRDHILERDNHCCKICKSTKNLNVHHKFYYKYPDNSMVPPWLYPDDALITLCKYHHKKWHDTHKVKSYYKKYDSNI